MIDAHGDLGGGRPVDRVGSGAAFGATAISCLVLLVPLTFFFSLSSAEYLRLGAVGAGLILLWKRQHCTLLRDPRFLAFGLILVVATSDLSTEAGSWIPLAGRQIGAIVLAAFLLVVLGLRLRAVGFGLPKLDFVDWTIIAAATLVAGVSYGGALLFASGLSWTTAIRIIIYLLIWLVISRGFVTQGGVPRFIPLGLIVVLASVSMVGAVRTGYAVYSYAAGTDASERGDYKSAEQRLAKADELIDHLGLVALKADIAYERAKVFYHQGRIGNAAEVLSLDSGFARVVAADDWEGPLGGRLHKNTSCWVDINQLGSPLEIRILATGRPFEEIWPKMRVELGDTVLGEQVVNSATSRDYVFRVDDGRYGIQRLRISVTNAFWQAKSGNRALYVDGAKVTYESIAWQ